MYCDLLQELANKPEKIREYAQEIRLVTNRGAALTRQLLIFSPQTGHATTGYRFE